MNPYALLAAYLLALGAALSTKSTGIGKPSVVALLSKPVVVGTAMAQEFDPDLKAAVDHLLDAANLLCIVQNDQCDNTAANWLLAKIGEIRDLASALLPEEQDWGGANVVPFRPRHHA